MESLDCYLIRRSWTLNLPDASIQEKLGQGLGTSHFTKAISVGYKMKSAVGSEFLRTSDNWSGLDVPWLGAHHDASLLSTCKQMWCSFGMWWLDVNAGIWTDLLEMLVCFSIKIIASGMVLPLKLSNCYRHSGSNMPTSSHKKCAYITTYTRHSDRSRNSTVWFRWPWTSTMNK